MISCAVVQDGKYDRLLRLLYDDIEKYETEVCVDTLNTLVLSFVAIAQRQWCEDLQSCALVTCSNRQTAKLHLTCLLT